MSQAQRTKDQKPGTNYKNWIAIALLLLTAFAFRLYVARRLANDNPGDGKLYALMARNLLEQHLYSHEDQPPYHPSLIRLPGYPLFLAGIYSVFGHYNNGAVRVAQALIDTCTCALIGILAFLWAPGETRRRRAALGAMLLAAVCPFTSIYVGTILTESWASFFAVSLCLLATLALRARASKRAWWLWAATGLLGGLGVFFRPDSGLFVFAVGLALVASIFVRSTSQSFLIRARKVIVHGVILSLAFVLVLVPWTLRNWRVFHLFQPLAPAHAEMPGEFVARGYLAWLRTWIDDGRYIEPVLWSLDDKAISLSQMPASAFDSAEEKARVAQLLDQYNHPATSEEAPSPTPTPEPEASPEREENTAAEPDEESDESDDEEAEEPEQQTPEMTPAIDAAFAQIARERIARAPLRYYLWLPLKRGWSLWVGPHSDYYPFDGELFPLADLDHSAHQQLWLPFFALLVAIYTVLGAAGAFVLLKTGEGDARRWLLLVALMIFIRLAFFSTIENPEPRYVVEFFPFLAALGGIAVATLIRGKEELAADKRG